ncbi:LCP family protein [Mariniluteicoccus flavus]
MPGRDDNMSWLYRGDGAKRPVDPADQPTRVSATPTDAPANTARSRRATFGEDSAPPRTRAQAAAASRTRQQAAVPPAQARPGRTRPAPVDEPPGPVTHRRRRRGNPVRRTMAIITALLVAWMVFLVGTPAYAWGSSTKIDAFPAGQRPADQPGELWLLVGSDSREGLTDEEKKELGTGSTEGKRTDTIMMLFVPQSGKPALVSVPRDSYVTIPGKGKNKINAAYAFGGEKLLVATIEQNTGLRVDHYAEIGFGGFAGVIDALGGVELCPKTPIKDKRAHIDVPAGCQTMKGTTALGYARMRYADPTGDLGRMNRQREMVGAMVKKAATPMTVLNPFRWWGVNMGAAQALRTDKDAGLFTLAGLAGPLQQVATGKGLTLMVPVSNPNYTTRAGSSMLWDDKRSKEMFAEIKAGDTSKLERFGKP